MAEHVKFAFIVLLLAATIMAIITAPIWVANLSGPDTCEDCVKRCKPFTVSGCSPGYALLCTCSTTSANTSNPER